MEIKITDEVMLIWGSSTRSLWLWQKYCLPYFMDHSVKNPSSFFHTKTLQSCRLLPWSRICPADLNMPVQCVNEWGVYQAWLLALIPDYLCLSNPATGEKKLAEERGLYDSWGVYFRAMLTTNTYLIININTFSEHFLSPVSCWGLISFISIQKIWSKIYQNSRI